MFDQSFINANQMWFVIATFLLLVIIMMILVRFKLFTPFYGLVALSK